MASSAGGDAVVNPHDLPPRISFAKLLRGGAIRAVAGRRMGAAREGGGRCRRNDDAIPAWYLVTNGTETMRIGRGDIVALRILLGVPVAIGFVFFGILVWAGINPPPPEKKPDPLVKAWREGKSKIDVENCILSEISNRGVATKYGVEKCLVELRTRR